MLLNPEMLVLGGAVVVPVVLHLLWRSRQETVKWGAMRFVEGVSPRRADWRRVRQWGVMALRCLAVGLVVAALARPVAGRRGIAGGSGSGGGGGGGVVVAVDLSGSTGMESSPGVTRAELVKSAAARVIAGWPASEEVTLLVPTTGEVVRGVGGDRRDVLARLAALRPGAGSFDAAAALEAGARLLAGGQGVRGNDVSPAMEAGAAQGGEAGWAGRPGGARAGGGAVALVTDRQGASYREVTERFSEGWRAGGVWAAVVTAGDASGRNLWVRSVEVSGGEGGVLRGSEGRVRAVVSNEGGEPRPGVGVRFLVDGAEVGRAVVDLSAGGEGTCEVGVRFERAGRRVVRAEIEGDAGPPFDDARDAVVEVREQWRVLVVSPEAAGDSASTSAAAGSDAVGGTRGAGRAGEGVVSGATSTAASGSDAVGGGTRGAGRVGEGVVSGATSRSAEPSAAAGGDVRAAGTSGLRTAGGGSGGVVGLALAPGGGAGRWDEAVVDVARRIPVWGLGAEDDEAGGYRVVVVPELRRVSEAEAGALARFVADGGGLFVGVGSATDAGTLRRLAELLPAEAGEATEVEGPAVGVEAVAEGGEVLGDPIGSGVGGGGGGGVMSGATVWRRRGLRVWTQRGARAVLSVPGREGSGREVFWAAGSYGAGRVVMAGAPLDGRWSDLWRSEDWVGVVREVVRWSGGGPASGLNAEAGSEVWAAAAVPGVELELPGGRRVTPRMERREGGTRAVWGPAWEPGVYRFRAGGREWPVAVGADARESVVRGDDETIAAAAHRLDALLTEDPSEPGRRRTGTELWPILLAAAAACLGADWVWSGKGSGKRRRR